MGLEIPPLKFKIMLESNPLKSTMLVGRLGLFFHAPDPQDVSGEHALMCALVAMCAPPLSLGVSGKHRSDLWPR